MEETVEDIVKGVMVKVNIFGFADQAWLLQEVADKLQEEASDAVPISLLSTVFSTRRCRIKTTLNSRKRRNGLTLTVRGVWMNLMLYRLVALLSCAIYLTT